MTIEKSIGWTDITRNPIKGRCKGGCWYCYYSGKRGIMNRFKHNPKIRIECNCLMSLPKTPKKIFLCSTHDLFGHWIPRGWRDTIFRWVEKNPQHIFQILTKFPQNIGRPMPDNVWLGVSITKPVEMYPRIKALYEARAKLKFISFEPLLGDVGQFHFQGFYRTPDGKLLRGKADWIIIGRLTGHGYKYDPKYLWIQSLVNHAKKFNTPLFMKNNLKDIWGEPLIQEFPE